MSLKAPRPLHRLEWDHPSASSLRSRKVSCGRFVNPKEIAKNAEDVTCVACLKEKIRQALTAEGMPEHG